MQTHIWKLYVKIAIKSNNPDYSNIASTVQTGDENHILIYSAMLTVSIFGLVRSRGRKEK